MTIQLPADLVPVAKNALAKSYDDWRADTSYKISSETVVWLTGEYAGRSGWNTEQAAQLFYQDCHDGVYDLG